MGNLPQVGVKIQNMKPQPMLVKLENLPKIGTFK